jgi:hypothetical protein
MGCNLSTEAQSKKGKGKQPLKGNESSAGKKKKKLKGSPESPVQSSDKSKGAGQKHSKKSSSKSPLRSEQSGGVAAAPATIVTAPAIVVTNASALAAPASSQSSSAPYTNPFAPRAEGSVPSELGQPLVVGKYVATPSETSSVASPNKLPKKKKKESVVAKAEDKWKDERAQGIRRREEVMGEAKLYIVQSWLDMARHELVLQSALPDPQDTRKQVELETLRNKRLQETQQQQQQQASETQPRPGKDGCTTAAGQPGSQAQEIAAGAPAAAESPSVRKRLNAAAMSSELGLKEWNALALAGSYLANSNIVEQLMFSDEEKRKLSGARGGISMDVQGVAAGGFFDDSAMTAVQANSERTREDLDSSFSELGA